MHLVLLLVATLFVIFLVSSIIRQDYRNIVFQSIVLCVLLMLYIVFRKDQKRSNEFAIWLYLNREQLRQEGANYEQCLIDRDSEFVQYEVCLSFGIFSYRTKTGYYVKGYHLTPLLNMAFSLYTLLFGWWAIPSGPIHTVRAIGFNLFAKPKKLEDVLLGLEAEVVEGFKKEERKRVKKQSRMAKEERRLDN
ncbi:hypothetical protein ABE142_13155 [Paenibacillus alvei]|uniref:hypothetical protein n=1 Tax=Paenibacillus alvei TaxID=44250 RepID=UPI003D26A63B